MAAVLCGCASIETKAPGEAEHSIYHTVEKGQTLWRIARMYNIDLQALLETNNIFDTTRIAVGQRLLIPQKEKNWQGNFVEGNFAWPLEGTVIAPYGKNLQGSLSKGITILSQQDQKVKAAEAGTVCFTCQDFKGYGKTLILCHSNNFQTVYSNLSEISVNLNDIVGTGAIIASAEKSAHYQGNLLHFQIRKDARAQDPLYFLPLR
jgi:murein DD-endopeptidase MepM/ murein hydrolase activator NlpD